ncbi:hypothetical protein HXT24_00005 [Gardnerella sp. DNF00354]|uniref:hypothetical protein n=1 Tax=Gardnerella sp. DNF00354 TaxID=2749046 RepID=UPI003BAEF0EA
MMNKKAIAAFAAGATLLAGFAAAPAFAAKINPKDFPAFQSPEYSADTENHANVNAAKNDRSLELARIKAAKTNGMSYGTLSERTQLVGEARFAAATALEAAKNAANTAKAAVNTTKLAFEQAEAAVKAGYDAAKKAVDENGNPKDGYAIGTGTALAGKVVKVDAATKAESQDADTKAADTYRGLLETAAQKNSAYVKAQDAAKSAEEALAKTQTPDQAELAVTSNYLVLTADGEHVDSATTAAALERVDEDAYVNGRIASTSEDDVYDKDGEHSNNRTMNNDHRKGLKKNHKKSHKKDDKKDDKKQDDTTTPDEKIKDLGKLNLSDAAKKKLAAHYVYEAKLALDEADNNLAEKKADYAAKRKTLLDTMTELAARKAAAEKANQDLTDFLASGENNSAKETALRDAVDRANAHAMRAFDAEQKAEAEFNAARDAAFAAVAAYNKALAEYKDAYNDAVRLGVNPAALPAVVTSDPLAADFPAVPGTKQIYADALNGKFGPAAQASAKKTEAAKAQAAAPAAAAGKAGAAAAKGELATKGGNGHKAGEKLGNAGVGVALTALAASMLAGMGAAVRKMRH